MFNIIWGVLIGIGGMAICTPHFVRRYIYKRLHAEGYTETEALRLTRLITEPNRPRSWSVKTNG